MRDEENPANFHQQIRCLIDQLRILGHDLWSIDEADDFEIWGPNYQAPSSSGVIVTFSLDGTVEVDWVES